MTDKSRLFNIQADAYRAHRPTYDPALFRWLAAAAPGRALAWDCGCGSGQATADLARVFDRVLATDISAAQLAKAPPLANVDYCCEPAEHSTLADASVDLTLVAQALHWFDIARFHDELRRVARPGGLVAVLSYNLPQVTPAIDALVRRLHDEILGPHWADERRHVISGYADLPFPFRRLTVPPFALAADWEFGRFAGYLDSWSAVATCRAAGGGDPVAALRPALAAAWGEADSPRAVRWPLTVLAGVVREP